jgi:hypothetical protein
MRKKSIVMKNLKSLVSKANSGFAPRSSSKERFGLENFIAASSSEILMTRGATMVHHGEMQQILLEPA